MYYYYWSGLPIKVWDKRKKRKQHTSHLVIIHYDLSYYNYVSDQHHYENIAQAKPVYLCVAVMLASVKKPNSYIWFVQTCELSNTFDLQRK